MSWLKVLNPTNYEVFYVSKGPNYKEDSSLALVFCWRSLLCAKTVRLTLFTHQVVLIATLAVCISPAPPPEGKS